MKFLKGIVVLCLMLAQLTACNEQKREQKVRVEKTHENLNSTIWIQTSVEYKMLCEQAFKMAFNNVQKALSDNTWTASLEQSKEYEKLLPAIIVDVDETILDNSPHQARLIKSDAAYSDSTWQIWVSEVKAKAIPGAKKFLTDVKNLGIKVFFVTNRVLEDPTVENLQKEIYPEIYSDDVFCKKEKPEWGSSKVERRKEIGKKFRVLLLVGDDYNDFAYLGKVSPEKRVEKSKEHETYWGEKWFIIPNPTYGNFDKSIWGYNYELNDSAKVSTKYKLLKE